METLAIAPAVATTFVSAFAASAVEAVEAFTIVLAVSVVRGWRPAVSGAGAALALLAAVVAAAGPMLARAPVHALQLTIGVLLLVFGLGWLRKAVLRASGRLPMHDEADAFASERANLSEDGREDRALRPSDRARQSLATLVAFKAVLLEGTEVIFIVLALASRPSLLAPAVGGAMAAAVLVLAGGLAVRRPLTRVPENTLKFVVGAILTGFGVYWCAEGLGSPWPGGDWAIPGLVAFYLAAGAAFAALLRRLPSARA